MAQGPDLNSSDVWTWVALCEDTEVVIGWKVGSRDAVTAFEFIDYIASRMGNPVQLSKNGQRLYVDVVEKQFASEVDYSLLTKLYGRSADEGETRGRWDQDPETANIAVESDSKYVSPSFDDNQSLMRRIFRRPASPLKQISQNRQEAFVAALALHYMHYNFCGVDRTLRMTPAMRAGISEHRWAVETS